MAITFDWNLCIFQFEFERNVMLSRAISALNFANPWQKHETEKNAEEKQQ